MNICTKLKAPCGSDQWVKNRFVWSLKSPHLRKTFEIGRGSGKLERESLRLKSACQQRTLAFRRHLGLYQDDLKRGSSILHARTCKMTDWSPTDGIFCRPKQNVFFQALQQQFFKSTKSGYSAHQGWVLSPGFVTIGGWRRALFDVQVAPINLHLAPQGLHQIHYHSPKHLLQITFHPMKTICPRVSSQRTA